MFLPSVAFVQHRQASALHLARRAPSPSSSQSARRFVPTTLAPADVSSPCLPRADERDLPHRSVMFVTIIKSLL